MKFHNFMQVLCEVYDASPALWACDYENEGFEWADCGNEGRSAVYSFVRRGRGQSILAVFNFDDVTVPSYKTRLPKADPQEFALAEKIFDSTWERFGGSQAELPVETAIDDGEFSADLPGFSASLFLLKQLANLF